MSLPSTPSPQTQKKSRDLAACSDVTEGGKQGAGTKKGSSQGAFLGVSVHLQGY